MTIRLVMSDADGTLFDFASAEAAALEISLKDNCLPFDSELLRLYSRLNLARWHLLEQGLTTQEALKVDRFRDFLRETGFRADPEKLSRDFAEALCQQRPLLPGVLEFCRDISAVMPLWLITNGISSTQHRRFDPSPIRPYFSGMLISGELGHPKPDPYMLEMAMKAENITDPKQAVFIGDSLSADGAAARAAGVRFLLLDSSAGPDIPDTVRSLKEAKELILSE